MKRTLDQMLGDVDTLSTPDLEVFSRKLICLKNTKTPLLRLPGELRNRIWRLALIAELQDQQQDWADRLENMVFGESKQKKLLATTLPYSFSSRNHYSTRRAVMDAVDLADDLDTFSPRPPIFFDACRQLKKEVESILYTDVMVMKECDQAYRTWKPLKTYQVSGLSAARGFRVRDMPLLKRENFQTPSEPETLEETVANLKYERFGIVTFAEELKMDAKAWTAGEYKGRQPSHVRNLMMREEDKDKLEVEAVRHLHLHLHK